MVKAMSREKRDTEPVPGRPPHQAVEMAGGPGARLQEELQRADPQLYRLLKESPTVETARDNVYTYLNNCERELYSLNGDMHPLEHATARECLRVLKNVIAPRNEAQAGFSTLDRLWHFVRNGQGPVPPVSEGFVQEFVHLFKGIHGQSGMAQGWLGPILAEDGIQAMDFEQIEGRAAGVARSDFLDRVSERVWALINRHPTGLDPELIAKREENKQRILDFFDATPVHWDNYAWQLGHIFKGPQALPRLEQLIPMTDEEKEAVRLCVEYGIPFGITPYYLSLFDFDAADRTTDAQVRSQEGGGHLGDQLFLGVAAGRRETIEAIGVSGPVSQLMKCGGVKRTLIRERFTVRKIYNIF